MKLKPLVRVIGIDDGVFQPREKGQTILVGVVSRLDNKIEGILHFLSPRRIYIDEIML